MLSFTAKTFHESPREVYKAAMKGAVKVTHSHLGESFILVKQFDYDNGFVRDVSGDPHAEMVKMMRGEAYDSEILAPYQVKK